MGWFYIERHIQYRCAFVSENEIREADKQMNVEESDLRQVTIINEAGEQETISYIDLERGKTALHDHSTYSLFHRFCP